MAVAALVRRAGRGRAAARAAESALVGLAALCLVAAAATLSGSSHERPATWLAALVGALAAGFGWWRGGRLGPVELARELDRRLAFGGGLFTAWECERAGAAGAVAGAQAARVARRLDPRRALRAILPSPALAVAAPLLGAACLAAAIDHGERTANPAAVRAALGGLTGALGQGREEILRSVGEGDFDAQAAGRLRELAATVARLERALADQALAPAEARAALAELDRELAQLGRRLERDGAARAALERARTWTDAALMALAAEDALAGAAPEPSPARPAQTPGADAPHAGAHGAGDALASAGGDGTMFGPRSAGTGPQEPGPRAGNEARDTAAARSGAAAAEPLRETAGAPGRWWAPRHDGLVERWLASRRAAPASDPPHDR